MKTQPPMPCPYPDCKTTFTPPHADPKRCPQCQRSLAKSVVNQAIARAAGKPTTKRKAQGVQHLKSLLPPRGTVKVAAPAKRLTARESCAAARRAMSDEGDPLGYPESTGRWWPIGAREGD